MPCMELFLELPTTEQQAILGNGKKLAIEAGVRFGWSEVIGADGIFVGMDGFGASGPGSQLYEHFGITAHDIAKQVLTIC